jgi:Domain of unknown function (DUF3854)
MHCDTPQGTTEAYSLSGQGPPLSERHRRELVEGSGLSLEVIAERGYRSEADPAELRRIGFADWQALPGLLIPLHGVDGSNGRYFLKPDKPRVEKRPNKPDRLIKYEAQAGLPPALDVPLRCLADLQDPTVRLVLTEGSKKADSGAAAGMCTISIAGVWAWVTKGRVPLKDFEPLIPYLNGREVVLAFDSDPAPKTVENVRYALRCLTNFLREHGAWVSWASFPAEPGTKVGLDDYLLEHTAAEFETTIQVPPDVGALQERVRQLEQQLRVQSRMLRNPDMRPAEKLVAIATINEAGWAASAGKSLPYRVNCGTIGEVVGLSAQAASSNLEKLAGPGGLFEKRVTRTFNEDAQAWRSAIVLTPRHDGGMVEMLKAAAEYHPERTKPGGNWRGRQCPDHPTANLVKRVKREDLLHFDCGCVVDEGDALKCQFDNSDLGAPTDNLAETPAPLNDEIDISEDDTPTPGFVPPPLRTTDGQNDNSERCAECEQPLHPGAYDRGICDPCARVLVAS